MSDHDKNTDNSDENLFDDDLDFDDFEDLDFEDDAPEVETAEENPIAAPTAIGENEAAVEAVAEPAAMDDDFEDISWDDFDDEGLVENVQNADADTPEPAPSKAKPVKVKKAGGGSLLKNKAAVGIVLVAAFGGGAFLYLQMTGGLGGGGTAGTATVANVQIPQDQTSLQEPVTAPDNLPPDAAEPALTKDQMRGIEQDLAASIEEAPPMPAPINSVPEDKPSAAPSAPEVLTPMPEIGELDKQPKLASLDEPLEASPTATQREALPAPPVETPVALEPPPAAPSESVSETSSPALQKEMESLAAKTSESAENLAQISNRVKSLEQRTDENNLSLNKKIQETNKKLDSLSATLAEIEKKISALSARQDAIKTQTPTATEPVPAPAPSKKAPAPKEEPAAASPATAEPPPPPAKPAAASSVRSSETVEIRPAPAPQWELRAAQPGKAMVANKSNGDVLNVSVGDSLRGIGRITAIEQEDGKWVVKGVSGSISQ